jgi:hypothetical protein
MDDSVKAGRSKAKSRGFAAFGIPVGATLVFKKDPAVTVKTLDGKNKVEYQGKPYSISTLAKQLVGSPVSGYLYFKYGDKVLKSLEKADAGPVSPEPAAPETGLKSAEPSAAAADCEAETGRDIDPLAGEIEEDSAESASDEADAGEQPPENSGIPPSLGREAEVL